MTCVLDPCARGPGPRARTNPPPGVGLEAEDGASAVNCCCAVMPRAASRATTSGLKATRTITRGSYVHAAQAASDQFCRSFTVAGASAMSSARIEENRSISPMRTTFAFENG